MTRPACVLENLAPHERANHEIPVVLKEMLKGGLSLLWRGYQYANDLHAESWMFAVPSDALQQAGLSTIDLQWLIARGYVEFSPNAIAPETCKQATQKNRPLVGKNACFVLTNTGVILAYQVLSRTLQSASPGPSENEEAELAVEYTGYSIAEPIGSRKKPTWDRDRKELRWGESIIKQFRWAAVNQETILMAFEEERWPPRIDDPLPQKLNQDPKSRLHDTIKCLNRNHRKRMIHFKGDGTGEGILWSILDNAEFDS